MNGCDIIIIDSVQLVVFEYENIISPSLSAITTLNIPKCNIQYWESLSYIEKATRYSYKILFVAL